jgi:hypothetical protein
VGFHLLRDATATGGDQTCRRRGSATILPINPNEAMTRLRQPYSVRRSLEAIRTLPSITLGRQRKRLGLGFGRNTAQSSGSQPAACIS